MPLKKSTTCLVKDEGTTPRADTTPSTPCYLSINQHLKYLSPQIVRLSHTNKLFSAKVLFPVGFVSRRKKKANFLHMRVFNGFPRTSFEGF
jgi:hypothetical protein